MLARPRQKNHPVLDVCASITLVLAAIFGFFYLVASVVALLWNFVMPIVGLPTLTPLQALAFWLLFRCVTLSLPQKPRQINNIVVNNKGKPENESI